MQKHAYMGIQYQISNYLGVSPIQLQEYFQWIRQITFAETFISSYVKIYIKFSLYMHICSLIYKDTKESSVIIIQRFCCQYT